MKRKLLVGETEDSVIVLEFEADKHLSLSGDQYDKPAFDEDEGEYRAREYLEDGELWKMAVEADDTILGLNDWIEFVLNTDGWEQTIGDIFETKDGKYIQLSGCGQIDMHLKPEHFTKCFIPKKDVEFIFECWKKYHLKALSEIPNGIISRILAIFETQSDIGDWDSKQDED